MHLQILIDIKYRRRFWYERNILEIDFHFLKMNLISKYKCTIRTRKAQTDFDFNAAAT